MLMVNGLSNALPFNGLDIEPISAGFQVYFVSPVNAHYILSLACLTAGHACTGWKIDKASVARIANYGDWVSEIRENCV